LLHLREQEQVRMMTEDLQLRGATFRIWTYKRGDRMVDFTHSFHSPAIDHEDYSIAYWMDGKHFNYFEGIVFCAAQTELNPDLDTVAEVKRQIERIMRERVPAPAQVAHNLRMSLEDTLRELGGDLSNHSVLSSLQSIENATRDALQSKES
jgi:hypothetical protein